MVCTETQGINFNPFNNTYYISFKCGFRTSLHFNRSWVSSVGIATRCVPDGPGIVSWWGRDSPYLSRPALGPTQLPIQCVTCFSWG